MFQLFSRISWIIAIVVGISIFAIDDDLFIIAVGATLFVRFFLLSDRFIKERVRFFADQISARDSSKKATIQKIEVDKTPLESEQEEVTTQVAYSDSVIEKKEITPREPNAIERFFSENLLAKLGGILVFLGVLFFLSLIYSIIGPMAKMLVGFAIAFSLFGAGVWLDKRGLQNEGRIVMGTAILINYLVILSGRYLLGNDVSSDATLLSVTTTFIFLIFNTVFAVATSLVYNSRTLLIFSFIFAYLNPLIVGGAADEPYTLLGYTLIVTLGAMYMSFKTRDNILFPLSFIFAAFLFLIAPWSDSWGWIAKLLSINFLGVLSLYVSSEFKKIYHYLHEILIGSTFFLIGIMGFLGIESIDTLQLSLLGVSSLGLMGFCYLYMQRGMYLYSIGTIGSILTLSPALILSGLEEAHLAISILIIGVFALMNISCILIKSKELLIGENAGNITMGLISGALFLTAMIYMYGNMYFPGMMQGFAFLGLAAVYSTLSFLTVQKIGIQTLQKSESSANIFYAISGVGISLFTLAIAFIFSEHKEIISIVWLLEASVLFYLANKTSSYKLSLAALTLFIIGVLRITPFLDTNLSGDYGFIVALCAITASLVYNVILLYSPKTGTSPHSEIRIIHNIFHIIAMGLIAILFYEVALDSLSDWHSLWYFSTVVTALLVFYSNIAATSLKIFTSGVYILMLIIHIVAFGSELDSYNGLKNIELVISTCMLITFALPYIYEKITQQSFKLGTVFSLYLIYLLCITTMYVYHFFPTTFSITLYWGILGSILLGYGIRENIIKLRTLGLYLIVLTSGKVFFYDIWVGVDNIISRVVALIVIGVLMIVLSTMYTRKYGNTLNSEFNLSNLFPKNTKKQNTPKTEPISTIQSDIQSVNISGISGVRMYIKGEKTIQIRAENLIKIAKLITQKYKKVEFAPSELQDVYKTISTQYKSSLSPSQYKRIKEVVKLFVDKGGKIEFVK